MNTVPLDDAFEKRNPEEGFLREAHLQPPPGGKLWWEPAGSWHEVRTLTRGDVLGLKPPVDLLAPKVAGLDGLDGCYGSAITHCGELRAQATRDNESKYIWRVDLSNLPIASPGSPVAPNHSGRIQLCMSAQWWSTPTVSRPVVHNGSLRFTSTFLQQCCNSQAANDPTALNMFFLLILTQASVDVTNRDAATAQQISAVSRSMLCCVLWPRSHHAGVIVMCRLLAAQ